MRALPILLVLLALLAPHAHAWSPSFAHTYSLNGLIVEFDDIRTFPMADPGTGVACYARSLDHGGPAGTITITVQDEIGDVVFVDVIAGAGVAGPRTQPIALVGFPGGTWTITLNAEGEMLDVQLSVLVGASATGAC